MFICLLGSLYFSSCDRVPYANETFIVTSDKSSINVGETVNFTIMHNAAQLIVYNGEEGHIYRNSMHYLTSNKTDDELYSGENFQADDPISYSFDLNMNHFDTGDLYGNLVYWDSYINEAQDITTSIDGLQSEIKLDQEIDQHVLVLRNVKKATYCHGYVRIFPQIPLSTNRNIKFRIRGTSELICDLDNNNQYTPVSETALMYFHVRLGCKLKEGKTFPSGSEKPWHDSPNGLPNITLRCPYLPTLEYQDIVFDLSQHIANYCSNNQISEDDIETINFIEFNNKVINSTGKRFLYSDELYISDISFGGDSKLAYSTGEYLIMSSADGVHNYKQRFDKPGLYEVTFIASANSFKDNYSKPGNESADNYQYSKNVVTKSIIVR